MSSSVKNVFLWFKKKIKKFYLLVPQGRMSAEAADRVAIVASGRPSTPLQTSWFEFLLDSSLLETHLQKANPGLCQHEMVSNGIKNVMLKCCFDGMIFF